MRNKYMSKLYLRLILTVTLIAFLTTSCGLGETNGIVTHTPTASLTPTCLPISLSTPEGWSISSNLVVILYDPRSIGEGFLGFENRETTTDIVSFVRKIAPKLVKPGDQISIFQLGYSIYDAAQVTRLSSYTNIPPLYNTPAPGSTLTPIPESTTVGGFGPVQATNEAKVSQTQRAFIEEQFESEYNCQKAYWNDNVGATASIWNITATAEVTDLIFRLESDFERFLKNNESIEVPFRTNELYYGGLYYALGFATRIFQSDGAGCNKYTSCNLIIIDDLQTWGKNNPDNIPIELNGVSAYVVMPNCRDIDSTSCQESINYWDAEFEKFKIISTQYWNGERAEINLLEVIRR
ncbi:MAG: hypothetical protein JNJ43_01580 [Anaerolineales bacterium]|nr:hypothetical protein [Anaerolineales bacterium]